MAWERCPIYDIYIWLGKGKPIYDIYTWLGEGRPIYDIYTWLGKGVLYMIYTHG